MQISSLTGFQNNLVDNDCGGSGKKSGEGENEGEGRVGRGEETR